MISINNLYHTYPSGVNALHGITLDICGTDPVAIIGQNGSGKTTLVKHLNALLLPTSGEITIDGEATVTKSTSQWAQKIGYVFQNPDDQLFAQNVKDELLFAPIQRGLSPKNVEKEMLKIAEFIGLENKLNTHPYDLTGSEKKFCAIGSVLMGKPDIVIFDEPTMGQDVAGRQRLERLLTTLQNERKLCITITHDMKFVARNFTRVIVMHAGKILLDGHPDDVFSHTDLLAQACVTPPPLMRVAQAIGIKNNPGTVREFVTSLTKEIQ